MTGFLLLFHALRPRSFRPASFPCETWAASGEERRVISACSIVDAAKTRKRGSRRRADSRGANYFCVEISQDSINTAEFHYKFKFGTIEMYTDKKNS